MESLQQAGSRGRGPTLPSDPTSVAANLLQWAQHLRTKPEFVQIAVELENLSIVAALDQITLEALEAALDGLGAQMLTIARASADESGQGRLIDAQLAADPELAQFKRRTTQRQFEQYFNQKSNRKLAEAFNLQQLSVFNMNLAES